MEVWKTIKGFENYEISNLGNVKNITTNRILKNELSKGYLRVTLSCKGNVKRFQLHRLVSIIFLENIENKPCINHINGIKNDNRSINLEWVSYSENEKHSYDILGKINPIRKLKKEEVIDIKLNCKKGVNHNNRGNVLDFMVKYKVSKNTILNILNSKYYV